MGPPDVVVTVPRTLPVPGTIGAADCASKSGAQPRAVPTAKHQEMKRGNDKRSRMREALEARTCVNARAGYDES